MRVQSSLVALIALGIGLVSPSTSAATTPDKINWSAVPKSEIPLFYPGQATQQWMLSPAHKQGAKGVRDGKNCQTCHKDEVAELGEAIVGGADLEPEPLPGKAGSIKATVQAAYDKEYLYLKASWPAKDPGMFHEYLVYRDGKWETYASHRANKDVKAGKAKVSYEDRFSVMLGNNDGAVANFESQGCWVTCHNSMRNMPHAPKAEEVEAHPVLGKDGLKRSDIRKYLGETRTVMDDAGGWDKVKDKAALDALMAKGAFLDLWQWRGNRSNPMQRADDSFVFQYRNFDSGKKPFFDNWDKAKKQPRFMYDPSKNRGAAALTEAQFRNPKAPLLNDGNRVAFDPNHAWKNGDIIPKYGNEKTEGSGDDLMATGSHAKGRWTIYIWRKLNTGQKDDIALAPGQTYPAGLAVHDDSVTTRFHYVSLPLKLSLGKKDGHINAVRIK